MRAGTTLPCDRGLEMPTRPGGRIASRRYLTDVPQDIVLVVDIDEGIADQSWWHRRALRLQFRHGPLDLRLCFGVTTLICPNNRGSNRTAEVFGRNGRCEISLMVNMRPVIVITRTIRWVAVIRRVGDLSQCRSVGPLFATARNAGAATDLGYMRKLQGNAQPS
jgi:hypothetical protein